MNVKSIVFALYCIILCGCGATTQTKQTTKSLYEMGDSSTVVHNLAGQAFTQWQEAPTIEGLIKTAALYSHAYKLQPNDANIQKGHYITIVVLSMMNLDENLESIVAYYNALNPAIQLEVASPGRLVYLQQVDYINSTQPKIELLKNALREYPQDAYLWAELSIVSNQLGAPRFAASLAKRAYELDPSNPEHAYQIAESLIQAIPNNSCTYGHKKLSKQAVNYYTKAFKINNQNIRYIEASTREYLRLGLIPIAYSQAKKAYALAANKNTNKHLMTSAYFLKKYQEAQEHADKHINDYSNNAGYTFKAAIAASESDWLQAASLMSRVANSEFANTSEKLTYYWLQLLAQQNAKEYLFNILPGSRWEGSIVNYLREPEAPVLSLIKDAKNVCEKAEAHFFTGMRYWQEGDTKGAVMHLKETKKLGATEFIENIWAHALIQSLEE